MKTMPENMENKPGRFAEDKGKVAWTLLAILLICMPLVAIGQLVVATDDELQGVDAQYLFNFDKVHRTVINSNTFYRGPGGAATTTSLPTLRSVWRISNSEWHPWHAESPGTNRSSRAPWVL